MAGDVNQWIGEGTVEIGSQKQFERRQLTLSFDGELDFHRGRVWPTIDRMQFEGTFRCRGPVDFDGLIIQQSGGGGPVPGGVAKSSIAAEDTIRAEQTVWPGQGLTRRQVHDLGQAQCFAGVVQASPQHARVESITPGSVRIDRKG
jgi:hypothetical protein